MKWTALLLGTLASACAFAEVKVDPARIVVVDCGYPRQQEELKRHLDLLTGRSVPIVKFAAFKKPQFGFFLGRKPSKSFVERKLLQTLRDEHEQSRLSYRAWTLRTKEDVQALIDFRRTHDRATIWGFEEKAFSGLLPGSL